MESMVDNTSTDAEKGQEKIYKTLFVPSLVSYATEVLVRNKRASLFKLKRMIQ